MSAAYKREPTLVTDPFLASRRLFDDLVAQASSAQALTTGHADVEEAIVTGGRGLLNRLFQDHMDLRSAQERRVEVVDDEGVRLSERRLARRTLRSLLGPVVVPRFLYQEAGRRGRAPGDAGLRLCEELRQKRIGPALAGPIGDSGTPTVGHAWRLTRCPP
jgi:hypothetical protein